MPGKEQIALGVEAERLAALERYGILDSSPEKGYEDITALAAFICGAPMSAISFVDRDRQWFKSVAGMGLKETPRSQSFCAYTIDDARVLIVPDALADERFRSNPLVVRDPNFRFYAGAPIIEKGGHVLGAVCVMDTETRVLDAQQIAALEALARQVMVLLEQRKAIDSLQQAVTEAAVADRLVRESERRLQTLANSLPALAWSANADGWINWYNRRWYEYTGTTPEQMEGWGWQSVHDPDALPAVMERWAASIRTGDSFEMVFPIRGADGVFRSFLTRVAPLRGESGSVTEWFGTNIEVDALKKTQLALEKSQEVLNQVLHVTSDAILSIDRNWLITYVNPKAEELYDSAKHFVGRNFWDSFPEAGLPGSLFLEHYHRAMYDGVAASFEQHYPEPRNFTIGIEVYPSKDGIVTFARDITRLKNAAAAVMQHEKLAAVGRLASSMSHELNNPLESVTNLLYLARQSQDLEEARPYLNHADGELRRVAAITSQTLRFHRQSTAPTLVTFAELSTGILRGQHSRLKNAQVTVEQRNRARRLVCCLEGEIRQVLTNLVSNAIDAMQACGGKLSIRGRDGTNWKTGERGMVITVADTGCGMSEATRKRVFEAFYTTKGVGGTGLGLWISREIVDRHHGVLKCRTTQRGSASGTVFTLFLPENGVEPIRQRN